MNHPADWEVAYAAGTSERPRITFSDRRYRRLDVFYEFIDFKPNIELMLDRYRREADPGVELKPLTDATGEWRGLIRHEPDGTVVHAGKFFEQAGCFVEAAVVWPDQRDKRLERDLLKGIHPCESDEPRRLWQAMGLSVAMDREYDLQKHSSRVGRIIWEFAPDPRRGPFLTVRRLAMPQHWLKVPLVDWLPSQIPGEYTEDDRRERAFNNHAGAEVVSSHRGGPATRLRRRRRLRLDVAWLCETEDRVYHISYAEESRNRSPELPDVFEIRCCREVHVPAPAGEL